MCSSLELKRLIELQKEANSIFNKLHPDMKVAVQAYADAVLTKISILTKLCKDAGLRTSRYEYHWASRYSHFTLDLDTSGYVEVYFIEHGYRGNSDETVHCMSFSDELFTEEGRALKVEELYQEELKELADLRIDLESEKLNKIAALEKELNLLKGATK